MDLPESRTPTGFNPHPHTPVQRLLEERLLDLLVQVAHVDSVADHAHIPHDACLLCTLRNQATLLSLSRRLLPRP